MRRALPAEKPFAAASEKPHCKTVAASTTFKLDLECPICCKLIVVHKCERFMPCCGEVLCKQCSNKWPTTCAFCRTLETYDPVEIVKRCQKLADAGRAIGQLKLGKLYASGYFQGDDHRVVRHRHAARKGAARGFRLESCGRRGKRCKRVGQATEAYRTIIFNREPSIAI